MKKIIIAGVLILVIISTIVAIRNNRLGNETNVSDVPKESLTKSDIIPGTYARTIESGGLMRTYTIHIPTGYVDAEPIPLVFLLHGGTGTGGQILTGTKFTEKADAETFIVVAPDGVDNNWNDGRGTTVQGNNNVVANDDVAFIAKLIEELKTVYNINESRMYTTGVSNGSMMSQRLACELPDTFAAIGLVSGPFKGEIAEACRSKVSVVGIQGTDDPFYPMEDGNGVPELHRALKRTNAVQTVTSIEEIAQLWVENNSCSPVATQTPLLPTVDDGTTVTKYSFTNCADGQQVEYYKVFGMGHGWPPISRSKTEQLSGPTSKNINATDVIWDFFKNQSK